VHCTGSSLPWVYVHRPLPRSLDLTSPFLPQRPELWNGRQEIFDEVSTKMVPDDILKKVRVFPSSRSSNPNPSLFSS
jgi:hypothetical protein